MSPRDDGLAVLAVDVGALDGPVIQARDAHVGPVDMASLDIHDDAIRKVAAGDDGRAVGAIRIHQVNAARVQFEDEETRDRGA
ncbi:hypothetical protein ACVWZR_009951 [Bradyrhizobium sp. i1.3.1]